MENKKRKILSISFFQPISDLDTKQRWLISHISCFQIQTVPTYLLLVSIAPRQRTCSHCQEYWLAARKTPSTQRYFSEANFLTDISYKEELSSRKTFSFLAFDVCSWYCFAKNRFAPFSRCCSLPGLCSTLLSQCCYPCVILLCAR